MSILWIATTVVGVFFLALVALVCFLGAQQRPG